MAKIHFPLNIEEQDKPYVRELFKKYGYNVYTKALILYCVYGNKCTDNCYLPLRETINSTLYRTHSLEQFKSYWGFDKPGWTMFGFSTGPVFQNDLNKVETHISEICNFYKGKNPRGLTMHERMELDNLIREADAR